MPVQKPDPGVEENIIGEAYAIPFGRIQ